MTAISLPLISWLPLPSPLAQPWRLARSRSQGQGEVGELCPESQQCATVPAIPRGGPKDGRGLGQSRGQANPSQQEVGLRLCGAVGAQGISQGACCSLPQEGKGPAGWAGDKGPAHPPESSWASGTGQLNTHTALHELQTQVLGGLGEDRGVNLLFRLGPWRPRSSPSPLPLNLDLAKEGTRMSTLPKARSSS